MLIEPNSATVFQAAKQELHFPSVLFLADRIIITCLLSNNHLILLTNSQKKVLVTVSDCSPCTFLKKKKKRGWNIIGKKQIVSDFLQIDFGVWSCGHFLPFSSLWNVYLTVQYDLFEIITQWPQCRRCTAPLTSCCTLIKRIHWLPSHCHQEAMI